MFGCDCRAKRYPRAPKIKPFIMRAAAKAVSLEERVFMGVSECSGGYRSLLAQHSKGRASCKNLRKGPFGSSFGSMGRHR
jgi:hypothetical protein